MSTASELVAALAETPESSYVRIVADRLTRGEIAESDPGRSGSALIGARVASAVAHLALTRGFPVPEWIYDRRLEQFWHPGSDAFVANALVHAPLALKSRGVLIERDSLESV